MTRSSRPIELTFTRTAYTVAEWAAACGLGETTIRQHIEDGNLVPSYPTKTKAIIPVEEGMRWLRTLPTEKPDAA
jgi:predicted transcriptional regulator